MSKVQEEINRLICEGREQIYLQSPFSLERLLGKRMREERLKEAKK